MSVREITEEEYVRLTNLNGFARSMLANPESAKLLEKAAKIVNPNIQTPRLAQEQATMAPITALAETVEKINARLDAEAAERANAAAVAAANAKRNEGLAKLRAQGWNDAGIAEIEKVMTEKGIADPIDAAIVFEKRYPPPTPAMPGSTGSFNFNEAITAAQPDEDIKAMLKTRGREANGLDAIVGKITQDTLAEIRSTQR